MWATFFALIMAASVSLSMVSFAVHAHRDQAIINAISDRATSQVATDHWHDTNNPG